MRLQHVQGIGDKWEGMCDCCAGGKEQGVVPLICMMTITSRTFCGCRRSTPFPTQCHEPLRLESRIAEAGCIVLGFMRIDNDRELTRKCPCHGETNLSQVVFRYVFLPCLVLCNPIHHNS
jgi:hypothetical protein